MGRNYWEEHRAELQQLYLRHSQGIASAVRFEVVTRALLENLGAMPQRVADVGGGFGLQAVRLGRAGHSVVIVDPDPLALAVARSISSLEDEQVQSRIEFSRCEGECAYDCFGQAFDAVCCHSVLMYQDDPAPLLTNLVNMIRPGGFISILSINHEALAMRSALRGRWRQALHTLRNEGLSGHGVPVREHSRELLSRLLLECGAPVSWWHGVGVFADHLDGAASSFTDLDDLAELEWLGGLKDPYRTVARSFHLIAHKL
jgi:S-adenosylmethionine-dependent methyltransferase